MKYGWQFSLRDGFWLLLLVAFALSWGLDHFRLQSRLAQADAYGERKLKQLETVVSIWNRSCPSTPIDTSQDGVVMKLRGGDVNYLFPWE